MFKILKFNFVKFSGGGHEFTCIITTEGGASVKTLKWNLAQGQEQQVYIRLLMKKNCLNLV